MVIIVIIANNDFQVHNRIGNVVSGLRRYFKMVFMLANYLFSSFMKGIA